MIITVDSPGAHKVLVYRNEKPVGLVQQVDTETKTLWRYDLEAFQRGELKLVKEPYDYLDMEGADV